LKKTHGRHTSAFILLFLCESEFYGARLFTRMQAELPHCFSDSADVYRCLNDMEERGCVCSRWEIPEAGQPRKWYGITTKGREALAECAEDIRRRQENFTYFAERYKKLR